VFRILARLDEALELSNLLKDLLKLSVGAFFLSHWVCALLTTARP
jgi:hypothetical protein